MVWEWQIDGWIVLAGALCAASAALLGNFLVLRRMSLMGDAISHAILPGLVAAFLISGERQGFFMFVGAVFVGVLTVLLTEFARQYGQVDEGASIGVVFTFLFALGLVMIVRSADHIDLDPGCVLYGALENVPIERKVERFGLMLPPVVANLSLVLLANIALVVCFYRQLKVSTFDPNLARAQGIWVTTLHYVLASFVAVTAVASFESVGNILVVAMFVVPPVTAWLLTNRLSWMILLSVVFGVASAILGHVGAIAVPGWFGLGATNTAGMMAVAAGFLLFLVALFAPNKGILARGLRSLNVGFSIIGEDILAAMYRHEVAGQESASLASIRQRLHVSDLRIRLVSAWLRWRGLVSSESGELRLAAMGRRQAQNIVRSHRLWEQYLASEVGFAEQHLHEGAEQLEHFTGRSLREKLLDETNQPDVDPHGAPIPPEAK